jgi:hypothetical protein
MSLYIDHYPNKNFDGLRIDIHQAFKEKLGKEELTNDLALKIFKRIKFDSDVKSFLSKPVVMITSAVASTATGFALLHFGGIALIVTGFVACMLGTSTLSVLMSEEFRNFFSRISQAYSEQSERAAEHIEQLQSCRRKFEIILA